MGLLKAFFVCLFVLAVAELGVCVEVLLIISETYSTCLIGVKVQNNFSSRMTSQ